MLRRAYSSRLGDRGENMINSDRGMYGYTAKNREYLASMGMNDARFSEPIDKGSNLHMAIKLLKAENSNLEKIIILLKTENQKMQHKMKELEYQNDRYKVTQNQLKTELKREKDMVKYLHGLAKKHERTIQKKDAESRMLRREAREADTKPADVHEVASTVTTTASERNERTDKLDRFEPRQQRLDSQDSIDGSDKINVTKDRPNSAGSETCETPRPRPQPPKRSDSFNIKRNRPFIVPRGDRSRACSYNSDSAVSGITIRSVNPDTAKISKHKVSLSTSEGEKVDTKTEEPDSPEWDDVTDVLGFLNEKVNQFERLLVETGGSSNSGSGYSSSDTIGPGK